MRQVTGELAGLVPVQTFEGNDGKGKYMIGVVAVVSQGMKDLAREILTAHGQIQPDPARAHDLTQLYADPAQLIRDFGVRRIFDGAGLPVVVSFAQWGSGYVGSDSMAAEQFRQVAIEQAEAKADAQIAQFVGGSTTFTSNSDTGREIEKAAERLPDDYTKDDPITAKITDGILRTISSRASVQVTGITTLYTWSRKHPDTGQPIVGVIRMWSAAGEKAVRELRDEHQSPATPSAVADTPHGAPSVQQGRDLMKASDF
jgi:hypothetical protein